MKSDPTIPALEIRDLRKRYKNGTEALLGIDLSVPEGQFFGLLGPNGAGKTTTINIVTGLVNLTGGSARVFGHDVRREFRAARRRIGLAHQELNFDWFFPIEELMTLQGGYYGVHRRKAAPRVVELLKQFGLLGKRNVTTRELSGGMKRRLQIAKALVHDPPMLILDEPTAGVDVELRRMLWSYLTQINKAGKTIILTTHYIEEAEKLCDRVAIIDKGKIIAEGSPAELIADSGQDGINIEMEAWTDEISRSLDGYHHHYTDGHLRIHTGDPELKLTDIVNRITAAGAVVKDVRICRSTLEDVFIDLTGRTLDV